MVILLAIENTKDLDTRIATKASDYKYTRVVVESDSNDFVSGEKATIRDYLYAMMFHSSADASMHILPAKLMTVSLMYGSLRNSNGFILIKKSTSNPTYGG